MAHPAALIQPPDAFGSHAKASTEQESVPVSAEDLDEEVANSLSKCDNIQIMLTFVKIIA